MKRTAKQPIVPPPEPPDGLSISEAETFRTIAGKLHAKKVLADTDLPALTRYCQMRTLWEKLIDDVNSRGVSFTVPDRNGKTVE